MDRSISAGSSERHFTLFELLVVIAIIAILASMLLPTLNQAREKGRMAVCTGNIKQLGLAVYQYVDDNDEIFPFAQMLNRAVELYTRPAHPPGCFVISDPTLKARRGTGRDAIARRLRRAQQSGDLPAGVDVAALTDYIDLVLRGLSAKARDGATRRQLRAAADVALRAWPSAPS